MRRPRVVPDWRRSWRWPSVWIPLCVIAGATYWRALGPVGQAELSQLLGIVEPSLIVIIGCAAAIAGRLMDQRGE